MSATLPILAEAKHEIDRLRRQNEILTAKVEVMELFACVLHTSPAQRTQSMCVDIAWTIQKEMDRLQLKEMPNCPACKSNARVTVSPPESDSRGEFFCPCNDPGSPGDSGHFNA